MPVYYRGSRNYLRVRGEYPSALLGAFEQAELPPRTRRIHRVVDGETVDRGTTSAYAENTAFDHGFDTFDGNYLRVRGEYPFLGGKIGGKWELPPRTRRIHGADEWFSVCHGTTSAYAENTRRRHRHRPNSGNYLRVRGEYRIVPVS